MKSRRALMAYGIGPNVATASVAELGDPQRFSSSRQPTRCAGLDITRTRPGFPRMPLEARATFDLERYSLQRLNLANHGVREVD